MSKHLGDYAPSTVIRTKFTTCQPSTGAPFTLVGSPALAVYKDDSTTQSTAGLTLSVNFDSVTGMHHAIIDTSADGTFYSTGSNFDLVLTAGTVDGISVAGTVIASFSIGKANIATLSANAITAAVLAPASIDAATFAADTGFLTVRTGTAQAGAAGSLTLDAGASAVNDFYKNDLLILTGGAGAGLAAFITGYNGTTKVATVSPNWVITPDVTTTFTIQPFGSIPGATAPTAADNAAAVWAAVARTLTAGTNIVLAKGVGLTGLNDLSAAQVNAEVLDVLTVDTFAEPAGAPPATTTLARKLGQLYMLLRNQVTVTDGTLSVYSDALAVQYTKTLSDAAGTYMETEAV